MLSLVLLLARAATGQTVDSGVRVTPSRPLWGELPSGPYRVGFRTIFRFDASRTWRQTRDYMGKFSPDRDGRPIQLNVWYPASTEPPGRQMTVGAYIDQAAPSAAFAPLNSIMRQRTLENWEGSVPPAQLPVLRATPVNAWAGTREAAGRFPVVLYFGGLNADVNSNTVLAEFLASHGYVVTSISLIGPTEQQPSQSRAPSDLDASVRDMEFALGLLRVETHADLTRLSVMGHSLGGVEAAIFAMRNGNVSAVVGLDGTYGFKGSTRVLTGSYGYGPWNMRADFLDLRRAQGQQEADLDLSAVRSFHHADLTLVTMTGMHHSDFTSFAMEAQRFGVSISPKYANTGWNRDTAQRGYEQAARIVLEFLNERMINGNRVGDSLQEMIRGIDGGTFAHLSAGPSAPSPREAVSLARDRGFEALRTLLVSACGEPPAIGCIDANMFNSKGYELLGQRANDALVLFKIAVWSNPMSANAQDSLADGYAAAGDSKGAREAIHQAIELARKDPAIDETSKASFIAQEKKRLDHMR